MSASVLADGDSYSVTYRVRPLPADGAAEIEMRLQQDRALLRELRMSMPASRFESLQGDGQLVADQGRLIWLPPAGGGRLAWRARIEHRRNHSGYDALLAAEWALFRASDIIPPAATRTLAGAVSETVLEFDLPAGWSAVTEYRDNDGRFRVDNPQRRFDRPTGWILLGDLGTRTDVVSGTRVTVAGPQGQEIRRMDMLALLRWTLPEIVNLFDGFPDRLTVVSAGDPMWRGGLSAPASIYIHKDRPLISENATSTLLHEVAHVALAFDVAAGADWITEGLAEFYSLQMLRRSGTISESRYRRALDKLAEWGSEGDGLCADEASGSMTARATALFAKLDAEIRSASAETATLDDVTLALARLDKKINLQDVRRIARETAGEEPETMKEAALLDCAT